MCMYTCPCIHVHVHVPPSLCIPVFLSPLSPHVPPYLCLYLPPTLPPSHPPLPSPPPLLPSSPPPTFQIQDSASRLLPLLRQPERCATDTHCPLHTGTDQSAALLRPHWAGQCIHYIDHYTCIHLPLNMYTKCIHVHVHVHVHCICILLYIVCVYPHCVCVYVCAVAARCAPAVTSCAECVWMSTSSTSTSSVWTAPSSSQSLAHADCVLSVVHVGRVPPEAAHFS